MSDAGGVAIRTVELCKSYDGGLVQALRGVDVELRRGELVAIMGPSGSGKSTFLNLVGTLDWPTSGQVLLEGRDVASIRELHVVRRHTIGFVFQLHNLIPNLTLLENVLVPLAGAPLPARVKAERGGALLARVGLAGRQHQRANRVSGGERQRAAIARALVHDPPIVLADEPTGSLDSENGAAVLELLTGIQREGRKLLVIVTHNPEIAARADRTLRFRDGAIVEA